MYRYGCTCSHLLLLMLFSLSRIMSNLVCIIPICTYLTVKKHQFSLNEVNIKNRCPDLKVKHAHFHKKAILLWQHSRNADGFCGATVTKQIW